MDSAVSLPDARSDRAAAAARVAKMDTPALRAELAKSLSVTAEMLSYLALVWRELESRGEDLSDLRAGMGQYLPLIAAGQLAAEVVVRFAGRLLLLRAVQTLPLHDQKALALGKTVKVATLASDDTIISAEISAASLTTQQLRLVFDHGRIRSVDEQRNMIESARLTAKRKKPRPRQYKVKVDRPSGRMQVGRMVVDVSDVLDALRLADILDNDGFAKARRATEP